jgi:tripartite-type tricarboxylate transporter receptor subunit TctC
MAAHTSIFRRFALAGSAFGALAGVIAAMPAWAQSAYPQRPVRMVVPFAPGGASDFVGRIMQPKLGEELGQQVVIDNRAGAAGNIGVEVAARANPDGYAPARQYRHDGDQPGLYLNLIKPVNDLVGIAGRRRARLAGRAPVAAANNVKELIDYAKANQGKLNFARPAPAARTSSKWIFSCARPASR